MVPGLPQWPGVKTLPSNMGSVGSILGQGTKIPHVVECGLTLKKKKDCCRSTISASHCRGSSHHQKARPGSLTCDPQCLWAFSTAVQRSQLWLWCSFTSHFQFRSEKPPGASFLSSFLALKAFFPDTGQESELQVLQTLCRANMLSGERESCCLGALAFFFGGKSTWLVVSLPPSFFSFFPLYYI